VRYVQRDTVLVSGRPFGIKMFTEGLMVVGFTDFSADGRRINPARSAGLATGDILLSLDGITLTSNEQMGALVQGSGGRPVQLVYQRQGRRDARGRCAGADAGRSNGGGGRRGKLGESLCLPRYCPGSSAGNAELQHTESERYHRRRTPWVKT